MGRTVGDHFLGYSDLVDDISKRNKDKVIHQELKEVEFDDIVLGAVAPESERLLKSIKQNSITLTELSEYEIAVEAKPCQVDQLLRVSFWDEVNDAIANQRPISERRIWNGVCSNSYWNKIRDEWSMKMAYVLCPLMSYSKANKLGMHLGQKAMIDILNASPIEIDARGNKKFNVKIAALQLQAYNIVQDRVHGKAVQRIQTHNTNETKSSDSIEELQKEIALLEGKTPPVTIEVAND